ncbi:hypothetical protein [Actinosynnema mirum]|uniref:hypothetical protein n=1 Tax=Actinosynnema mirum TaxID=40567 RepID=UPI00019ACAA2|nr:hypothetical protein [Actinosynnema mirum]
MDAVAREVTSPIAGFDAALAVLLEFVGVNPVLVAAVLLAYALESWYSNMKKMIHLASTTGGALARGSVQLASQRPVRILFTLTTTATVVLAQVMMVRLSYVGGSVVSLFTDPVSLPFGLLGMGAGFLVVVALVFDSFFFLFSLPTSRDYEWPMVAEYVLDPPRLTMNLVFAVYCGTAFIAVYGAATVRRLWASVPKSPI